MSDFECHVREGLDGETRRDWRNACKDLDLYRKHRGKRYCVLHYPGEGKEDDFKKALEDKLAQDDFHFGGTVFPEGTISPEYALHVQERAIHDDVIFRGATFVGRVRFFRVTFNGDTDFSRATFAADTSFAESIFNDDTAFQGTQFSGKETSFRSAQFSGKETSFRSAQFSSGWTNFQETQFSGELTNLSRAQFTSPRGTYFTGAQFNSEVTNFLDAQFSSQETNFARAQFSSERTYFSDTQFSGERTVFSEVQFDGQTDFHDAALKNATFESTTFQHGADFSRTSFRVTHKGRTDFRKATFRGEAYFKRTEFEGYTDFYRANFLDAVKFIGYDAEDNNGKDDKPQTMFTGEPACRVWVSFKYARVERPELLTFYALRLRPGWFANVNGARAFGFSNVEWYTADCNTQTSISENDASVLHEAEALLAEPWPQASQDSHAKYQMERAYRELALNAEENHRYDDASRFRYLSMEARRMNLASSIPAFLRPIWWYRVLSGYGEKPGRSAQWLAGILTVFALLYLAIGLQFHVGPVQVAGSPSIGNLSTAIWEAFAYSLGVLTLQSDPLGFETSVLLRTIVWFEGIVGPLQIALLALALRRRFMRST